MSDILKRAKSIANEVLEENCNFHHVLVDGNIYSILRKSHDILPELVTECERLRLDLCEAKAEAMYNNDCITDDSPLWNEAKEKITIGYREQASQELGIECTQTHTECTGKHAFTAEQRLALEKVCYLADGYECKYAECAKDQENALSVVRSMLNQSSPVWQITEERKAALQVMGDLRTEILCPACGAWIGFDDIKPHMAILRAMLAEAEGKI
jgi:hypothetical protein